MSSYLFKQVDNSQLDEMSHKLWQKASLDATYLVRFSTNYPCSVNSSPTGSCSLSDPPSSPRLNPFPVGRPASAKSSTDQLCTLYMDMTYDDRVFFGVHNFFELKQSLRESQCNIDFSAPDNKVSITGQVASVHKMCTSFILHSTLALQFEFRFYNEKYLNFMRTTSFVLFHKQCELYHKVYVNYRRSKPNVILFNFVSFRNNSLGLIRAMVQLKNELEFCQVGELIPNITSVMQIPANRRDLTGRGNSFIEQIQQKTHTKIEVTRLDEHPHHQFENVVITGQTIPSVIQARFELASRFTYELKFQMQIAEKRPLVDYISKLSYDLKSVNITLEPCGQTGPNSKIIAINGNEKSLGKLFTLREKVIMEVDTLNSTVRKFLT